jgi:peptide/nickel transport system substrate-binding protein
LVCIGGWARTRPHYGGTIRAETEGDPWQKPDGIARRLVLDGLVEQSPSGELHPALAVEWKSENNAHRWQFKLRPGVHFQDGSPLTSVAVVAALGADCTTNCPWSAVRAVGSSIVFTADDPMPNVPALLAGDDYLIALKFTADGGTPQNITGTGPFQVSGFTNGVLTLAANDSCWQGRPFADAIEVTTHRAIHDQWLDLSLGRTDVAEVPSEQMRQAQQQRLTVLASAPVTLLALQVADSGALANANLRAAIGWAVDRTALSNVIFQKQGEITASLLPANLSAYAFLFPSDRDLAKAQELRGGLNPGPLTLATEASPIMQLAAQRIALNLHEAGFNVQVANSASAAHAGLVLKRIAAQDAADPSARLESILRSAGAPVPIFDADPTRNYQAEHDFLDRKVLIPLLYLPRAYALGARLRDVRLRADGAPDLADASIEDAP